MKRTAIVICAALAVASAGAGVTLDFEELCLFDGDAAVSEYISDALGATVTTEGAYVGSSLFGGLGNMYLSTSDLCDPIIEMTFAGATVSGLSFTGYVFRDNSFWDKDDFHLQAYAGDTVVFDAAVNKKHAAGTTFDTPWIDFAESADRLVFSNNLIHDIAIDNLTMRIARTPQIPLPAAVLLGMVGLGAISLSRRQLQG